MSEEPVKLRLRPKLTGSAEPGPAPATPAVAVPVAAPVSAAPLPAVAASDLAPVAPAATPAASVPVDVPVDAPVGPIPTDDDVAATRARRKSRIVLAIAGGGAIAFVAAAYFAFPRLIARQLKQDQAAARPGQGTMPASRVEPDSAPPPPASAAKAAAAPVSPAEAPPPAVNALEHKAAVTAAVVAPPEPSPEFRAWVQAAKIAGLRTGDSPRLLIAGAAFRTGDVLNHELGIAFAGYDTERRVLLFKDASGATVERRHP